MTWTPYKLFLYGVFFEDNMLKKYNWPISFLDKELKPDEINREICRKLSKCPRCGYVYENFSYSKPSDKVVFSHTNYKVREGICTAKLTEIRTSYHIKRAALLASRN